MSRDRLVAGAVPAAMSRSTVVAGCDSSDSTAQHDPLYIVTTVMRFTATDHRNLGETPGDHLILAAGPVKGAQTQPLP